MQQVKVLSTILVICFVLSCLSLPARAEVGLGFKGGMLIPDQAPFKDEFDSDVLLGGVLEMDSNLGLTLEASVEYYSQKSDNDDLGGDITIYPIMLMAKYNFFPRYRTTPFVGLGAGAFFFDRDYRNGSESRTRFGARVCAGVRFLEDRRVNIILEGARNFTDFDKMNASSFQVTLSVVFDLSPSIIGGPQ